MIATRRSFLGFLAAAPFVVKASSLMPVRALFVGDGVALISMAHPIGVSLPADADISESSLYTVMRDNLRRYEHSYSLLPRQWGKVFDAEKGAA